MRKRRLIVRRINNPPLLFPSREGIFVMTEGSVKSIALARVFWCPANPIKPFSFPPVQLSEGIFVINEKRLNKITMIFAVSRNDNTI